MQVVREDRKGFEVPGTKNVSGSPAKKSFQSAIFYFTSLKVIPLTIESIKAYPSAFSQILCLQCCQAAVDLPKGFLSISRRMETPTNLLYSKSLTFY